MNTKTKIEVHELDGCDEDDAVLIIKNHWHFRRYVVIGANGSYFTVVASDLIKAIENATNV